MDATVKLGPAKHAPKPKRKIVTTILLMLWALIQLFPLYWMFGFSLKDNFEIFGGNMLGLPHNWLWGNYETALGSANVARYLFNSVVVTGATILITLLLSLTAAYALNRMVWKARETMRIVFMLGLMIPLHAALLPLYIIFAKLKLLNTYLCLILPYTAFAVPMGVMMMGGFIGSIPRELEDAACIDGCNIYRIVF